MNVPILNLSAFGQKESQEVIYKVRRGTLLAAS